MRAIKTVLSICLQNLRKWATDYRVMAIAVLAFIMVQIYIDDMRKISAGLGTSMPIWIFPFLYSQFFTKIIYTLLVVLLFCNAPFIDSNQTFVYIRSGRKKWLCGQILYIIFASAFYYIFLFAATLLSTVFVGEISLDWGKTLTTTANSNAAQFFGAPFVVMSNTVTGYFTPLQAVWFTFLVSWLCGILIGLIIFLCNLLTGTRFVGTTIASLLVVLCALVDNGFPGLLPYSPVSWNTLDKIDVGGSTSRPTFFYCTAVYLSLIAILTAAILIFGGRKNFGLKEN